MKTYRVTVAPAVEPVDYPALKRFLRVDWADDDPDLVDAITAARQWLERKTGRALMTQTVQLVSTLTDSDLYAPISGLIGAPSRLAVELTPGPVQAVSTVEFETATNQWRALTADTEYLLDNPSQDGPAYVALADWVLGYWTGTYTGISVFPIEARGPRLRVTYTAGYGVLPTAVPYTLREAVRQAAAWLYDNRGAPIPDSLIPSEYVPWRL